MHITVDIDGILTKETIGHDYKERSPNIEAIKNLQKLQRDGYKISLYSSRYLLDRTDTIQWLLENQVPFDRMILGKPNAEAYIDDKSLPYVEPNLNHYLNYHAEGSCWRHTHSNGTPEGEKHPCYFCGKDIDVKDDNESCSCGIARCESCGKCLCNIPLLSRITVIKIHEKYCKNLPDFNGKIELDGFVDMSIIKNFLSALSYCKKMENL